MGRALLAIGVLGLAAVGCFRFSPPPGDAPARSEGGGVLDRSQLEGLRAELGASGDRGARESAVVDALSKLDAKKPDLKKPVDAPPFTGTTWSPTDKQPNIVLSSDLLTASEPKGTGSVNDSVRAVLGRTSGRYYFELTIVTYGSGTYNEVGVGTSTLSLELAPSDDGCGYDRGGSARCSSSGGSKMLSAYAQGDVIGVAVDLDKGFVYFRLNGVWQKSADPVAGTGGLAFTLAAGSKLYPVANFSAGDATRANFGGSPFSATPPTGYVAGW